MSSHVTAAAARHNLKRDATSLSELRMGAQVSRLRRLSTGTPPRHAIRVGSVGQNTVRGFGQ
jgi:hypothetical protein